METQLHNCTEGKTYLRLLQCLYACADDASAQDGDLFREMHRLHRGAAEKVKERVRHGAVRCCGMIFVGHHAVTYLKGFFPST